jgi:CheY-like chemotaxis protein
MARTALVLIVEDDAFTSSVVSKALTTRGVRTRIESNGAAALLAAHEEAPDVILMDLQMPILKGRETLAALRANPATAHIPVVVLSTHSDDVTLLDAITGGANVFLAKPPDAQELLSVVECLLALRPEA